MRTGAPWKDLPEKYGSDSTCHRRLHRWQAEGVWERIWKACLRVLDGKGTLDWRQGFIDGTFAPAKKGGLQSA
jgi:transposase